jgi:soluble lytic murein transglycosylase-like protein
MSRTLAFMTAFLWMLDAEALEALGCPRSARAVLLEKAPERLLPCLASAAPSDRAWGGHALRALGRPAEASRVYLDLAAAPSAGELSPVYSLAAARTLREAGLPDQGLTVLKSVEKPRWLRAEALATRAELLFAAGELSEAIHVANEALASRPAAPEFLALLRLRAALGMGDVAEARQALRTMRVEFVGAGLDAKAEAAARAGGASTALTELTELGPGLLAERWRRWVRRGSASEVAAECAPTVAALAEGQELTLAQLECGKALAATRRPGAEALLEKAAVDPRTTADALLALARLRGRGDDPTPVASICQRLAELKTPDDPRAECEYLSAFMLLGKAPEAGRRALAEMAARYPRHPRATDARWQLVFATYESDPAMSLGQLEAIVKANGDAETAAQALYWRGRLTYASDPRSARAAWTRVLALDPLGYYGWLAEARLGGKPSARGGRAAACGARTAGNKATPAEASFAQALDEAGFGRLAGLEIDSRLSTRQADALAWAPLLEATNRWTLLHRIGLARGGARAGWPVAPERLPAVNAAFPISFPRALESVPEGERCLVLAVMRRESLYDPAAVSQAKARGLLQLLPETAAKLAKELGRDPPSEEELHDPALNVLLASRYLRRLGERFESPLLVAAAYNAGPGAVLKWLGRSGTLELDLFVERIPFRETRHYVKAVGGALAAYSLLTTGVRPTLSLTPVSPGTTGIDY